MSMSPLGADDGPGFGWRDVSVVKFGVAWKMSDALTLCGGYNRGTNPIRSSDVTFNILAPGVMTSHYTAGFTYVLSKDSELNGAAMFTPRQTGSGTSMIVGTETIGMRQYSVALGWSKKF